MNKNHLVVLSSRRVRSGVAAAVLLATVTAAQAAANLPAALGTAVTQATDDAQGIFDLAFPYIAAVVGLGIIVRLFKRFVR